MGSFETIKAEVRGKISKERGQWKDSNQKIQARTAWGQFLNIQGENFRHNKGYFPSFLSHHPPSLISSPLQYRTLNTKINGSYNNDSQEERKVSAQQKVKESTQNSGNIPWRRARMKVMQKEKSGGSLSGKGWGGGYEPQIIHNSKTCSSLLLTSPHTDDRYHMTMRKPGHCVGL